MDKLFASPIKVYVRLKFLHNVAFSESRKLSFRDMLSEKARGPT